MKSKFNKWSLALIAAAAVAVVSAVRADQQGFPQTFITLTNEPAVLANSASTGWTNEYIPLRTYSGLGLQTIFQATNSAGTGTVTVVEWPSYDGTNANQVAPFGTQVYTGLGTNPVFGGTNWSQLQLKGIAGLFVNITNNSGTFIYLNTAITNWANTNAPFPGGVLANRPNQ